MTGTAARFSGLRRLRPPRVDLLFDVTLRGAEAARSWVVLPTSLEAGRARPQATTAHTLEIYELAGTGRVVVACLRGEDGLAALLLEPGAELTLTGFPIACWEQPPDEAEIEIVTASGLLIDGQSLEDRVKTDVLCDREGVAGAGALADQRGVIEALGGGLATRMTVQLVGESPTSHAVALADA